MGIGEERACSAGAVASLAGLSPTCGKRRHSVGPDITHCLFSRQQTKAEKEKYEFWSLLLL
jgi:hypothetical protein